jgi:hypothetical protein
LYFEGYGKPRKLQIVIGDTRLDNFIPMICALHCMMRCTDNLFVLLLKSITEEQTTVIENRMREMKGFSQFQFRTTARTEIEDEYDQTDVKLPYMNGKQVKITLENHEEIFKDIYDEVESIIWKIERAVLLVYIQGTTEQLRDPLFNLSYFRQILLALARILRFRYPGQRFSHYLHIVIEHAPQLLEEHKSLTKFSKEVDESKHCDIERKASRITSAGGLTDANRLEQVILINLRRLLLTEDYNIEEYDTVEEINMKKKRIHRENQEKWLLEIKDYVEKLTSENWEEYLNNLQVRTFSTITRVAKQRRVYARTKNKKQKLLTKARSIKKRPRATIDAINYGSFKRAKLNLEHFQERNQQSPSTQFKSILKKARDKVK